MTRRAEPDFPASVPEAARGREATRYSRILIGTDGSACSGQAALHAVYLAESLGAKLYVLYAVDIERAFHLGVHFGEGVAELESFGKEATSAIKAVASERGVECEEVLRRGHPHKAVIEYSDEISADLIVIGSVGRTSVERVLVGSESEKILRYSKRPVLLVHGS